jgi:23S rRNA pseudouridine2605 synthase
MASTERVHKVLSQQGISSRRQAEQLILAGRVRINGVPAKLGQRVDPQQDAIEVDGHTLITYQPRSLIYVLLHKPAGVVCTCKDPQARTTVLDLLPARLRSGVYPVGRLDTDSTGALLLTNDGDLTFYLTHPRYHVAKTYHVWVQGIPTAETLRQWRQGILLQDRLTLPAEVTVMHQAKTKTLLKIVLHEGRNRQIRRVAEQLGYPVLLLHRVAIGSLTLQTNGQPELKAGQYRQLTLAELPFQVPPRPSHCIAHNR